MRGHHLLLAASEVGARRPTRHKPALSIGTVAEECNLGGQQLLLNVLVAETAEPAAAPGVDGAGVSEAGAVNRAARHVDDFLAEDFAGWKRVFWTME